MNTRLTLSPRHVRELWACEPRLVSILCDMLEIWPAETCNVTSIYRTPEEEDQIERATGHPTSRIHTAPRPHRAIDLSVRGLSSSDCETMARAVNSRWTYDPQRPQLRCVVWKPHGTGPHFHLQTHERTLKRS